MNSSENVNNIYYYVYAVLQGTPIVVETRAFFEFFCMFRGSIWTNKPYILIPHFLEKDLVDWILPQKSVKKLNDALVLLLNWGGCYLVYTLYVVLLELVSDKIKILFDTCLEAIKIAVYLQDWLEIQKD